MDTSISFSKIVATPTLASWSQVYNAGKLFAVLSLEKTANTNEDLGSLNVLGKSLLDRLEQEFFTTETKDLESIKKAISATFEKIKSGVIISFVLGFISRNILYLFILGKGNVFILRDGRLGKILSSSDENVKNIVSSSGFVKDNDLIILATFAFLEVITLDDLTLSLKSGLPTDATEQLAPKIHKTEDGRLAAIIIKYNKPQAIDQKITISEEEKIDNTILNDKRGEKLSNLKKSVFLFLNKYASLFQSWIRQRSFKSNPKKIVFLIVSIAIVVVLISSIFQALKNQNNAKVSTLFSQVYTPAQKKYDEGNSLLDLNKNLARDSFLASQKILQDNKSKFPANSKEEKQILELLQKVNDSLDKTSGIISVTAKEVSLDQSGQLSFALKNPSVSFVVRGENVLYSVDQDGVFNSSDKKIIIKNESFWISIGGLGFYLGNFYLLDNKQNQILKFVPAGSSYSKTNYFAEGISPDLSSAKSIAIDGSIWILLADGNIEKFTRGKIESFIVSGLDKPFSAPSRISTNSNTSDLYILDNGNSRIVVLTKEGSYKSQYQASVLKDAKDFEVKEADKKIFVLSQNKVYEITLK